MTEKDTSFNAPENETHGHEGHKVMFGVVLALLAIAIAGDIYLMSRSNQLADQLAQTQTSTEARITKLSTATTALLEQRLQALNDAMDSQVKQAHDTANSALSQLRSEARKQNTQLAGKLDEQAKELAGELSQLKEAASNADTKITEVSGDVNNVKTDVNGVKSDVASTRSQVDKDNADLKRMMGDMGVMSGLIATNAKDLDALRQLGDRNYFEFTLNKKDTAKKVGDITLTLKKADPKRSRYTLAIGADDKMVEKRDKTINEPVQIYVSGARQPDEVVVNQVNKDTIVGYVATPKVRTARR